MANRNDLFSRFVNWLSASGRDTAPIKQSSENRDPFSRLMNLISG
ncbi:MAG: ferredoxin--nitrite reductase [Cyanobium sp. NAT70]|nr:ferredoxin--nitrite reductase [Cyanobium sp. NAT70]